MENNQLNELHNFRQLVWMEIGYARLDGAPNQQPYHHLGKHYSDLWATSSVTFNVSPCDFNAYSWVACKMTCHTHPEGSLHEIQICTLAAPPIPTPPTPFPALLRPFP